MTILLTGGAGYLGSHTAAALLAAGYDVVLADNFSNSSPDVPARILRAAGRRPVCCRADVRDRAALSAIFAARPIGGVIHFAGSKAVGTSRRQPLAYYRNNLDATLTLLEVMADFGCRTLIFSSSATVYGEGNPAPYTEDMETGRCSSPYGWSKFMCERILTDAARADPTLAVVLLRYFNPVGAHGSGELGEEPAAEPDNLMPRLIRAALGETGPLTVYGEDWPTPDGTGIRDYLHVTDLARGHLAALAWAEDRPGAEAFNLGTGRGTSVRELIGTFRRATGAEVPWRGGPRRPGDLAAYWADPGKARRVLGWQAEKSLEDMCRDAWNRALRVRGKTPPGPGGSPADA